MLTLKSTLWRCLALAVFVAAGSRAAYAPGSIPLSEVMQQLSSDPKLIAAIKTELKAQSLDPDNVICVGRRFGNHWENLGGAARSSYECRFGERTLDIDGELHPYDAA